MFKADAVEFAVSGTIGELLEIEVENLGCLGKIGCAIGLDTKSKIALWVGTIDCEPACKFGSDSLLMKSSAG
ncbi:hypothetical protein ABIA15_005476 [Sinorhizobium fredii]